MPMPIERQSMRKVCLGILAFILVLCPIRDRVRLGFAALTMNRDFGLSAYVFGRSAGAFSWGYFLCSVPSDLNLQRPVN